MRRVLLMVAVVMMVCSVEAQFTACSPVSYIKATNTGATDNFGVSVAMSADGLTLAVSATNEDGSAPGINPDLMDNAMSNSGAVYVYVRSSVSALWTFQAFVKAGNPDSGDLFGGSIALSDDGNTMVVSARSEDGGGSGINPAYNNATTNSGAVYVYSRTGTTWVQQAYIKSSFTASNDDFGTSVSLNGNGNTLAVGASRQQLTGTVYVYERTGSSWSFEAFIKDASGNTSDFFGSSVSLSTDGNTLAVGISLEDGNGTGVNPPEDELGTSRGAVKIYRRVSGIWSVEAYLKPSFTSTSPLAFGSAVSLSGNGDVLLVGAPSESNSGTGVDPVPVVDINYNGAGAAFVFVRNNGVWIFEAYLKAINTGGLDAFGERVTVSKDGSTLLVSAYLEDGSGTGIDPVSNELLSNTGAAYLYKRSGGLVTVQHYLKMPGGSSAGDQFGRAVALNATGTQLVFGVSQEDGSGMGINPPMDDAVSNAGAVFEYSDEVATAPVLTPYNAVTNAVVCDNGHYVHLRVPTDASGRTIIARIDKNGNSFTVSSALVDALASGTYVHSSGGQTGELKPRMLTISTSPASGLTVNGGPIVRMYYSTAETFTAVGMNPIEQWLKHPGSKAAMLGDLTHSGVYNSTELFPVAAGIEQGVTYADFQVTSFSTFAQFGYLGVLPVQLHSFSGHGDRHRGVIQLTWNTSSEQQSSHFEIEHSLTGTDFVQVGRVAAAGTSVTERRYAFAHATQVPGNHYYRLKQVDKDGRYVYSGVIKVQLTAGDVRGVVLYPVPAKDQVQLQLTDNKYAGQTVQLLTAQGQLLRQVLLQGNRVSIDLRGMAAGVYVLRLPDGNVQRFVKE